MLNAFTEIVNTFLGPLIQSSSDKEQCETITASSFYFLSFFMSCLLLSIMSFLSDLFASFYLPASFYSLFFLLHSLCIFFSCFFFVSFFLFCLLLFIVSVSSYSACSFLLSILSDSFYFICIFLFCLLLSILSVSFNSLCSFLFCFLLSIF